MDRHNDDDSNDNDNDDADTTGGWIILRSEFLIPSRTKTASLYVAEIKKHFFA